MAVKTITIDMEAYELLSQEKRGNESFSKVIKRTIKTGKKTAKNLLSSLDSLVLEEDTLDRIDELTEERKNFLISSPILDEGNQSPSWTSS
jgi:predicted CopG family antitoxin